MQISEINGRLSGKGKKFAIVVSRFNDIVCERLLSGALDCLKRHEVTEVNVYRVPGAFEIPPLVHKIKTKNFDAIICLGAVIRGETPHFDYVSSEVTKGIAKEALESKIPIIYGIITADTIEQALDRAGLKSGNRGWDAALSAIEMSNLYKELE